jgi:hypothetical protein
VFPVRYEHHLHGKTKACLDDQLSDGGQVVKLRCQPRSTPQTYFMGLISAKTRVKRSNIMQLELLGKLKKKK